MTADIKRRIDAARQVLVGVVPNPTSQIDQITNALIYKFMDFRDRQATDYGGERTYFTGDLEHYAWTHLMNSRIGNQERMNLYSEALTKFSQAEQLPKLFRDIFADAFLPYRSPETLGLFLGEIDHFDCSNPEELGNAYEYLLSIMSSQGDAGQFRTPSHIIDFIVDVVNPVKDDKVLDPACGTGGFLVSSYKHILEQHDGKNDPENKEKPLTPDERIRLATNFEGYEIDPGMARIARVNMYLHQFKNPKIHQYDTLSSDERWRDKFSVILANPPFMSPKGGIQPHDGFSIKSSRSEVLFVDYIMSHLRPDGRAGIIVPEGIIFQSGIAYKQLRKNLVKDGLYAVVSLPTGVFMPYSGVKTSILLFNNEVAKQRDEVLFVKVKNDGFHLGATRRPIEKNDIPDALDILNKWRTGKKSESNLAMYVRKTEIAQNDKYDLTGDRYRKAVDYSNVKWPIVELGEVCEIQRGTSITKKDITEGEIPVIAGGQQPAYYHNRSNRTGKTVTVSGSGAYAGFVNYFETPIFASDCSTINPLDENRLKPKFCFYLLKAKQREIYELQSGMGQPHVYPKDLKKFKIPLPPIEVQAQIMAEIDQYQKVIDGAKQVVQNWKPYFRIDPDWDKVELGVLFDNVRDPIDPQIKTGNVIYVGLKNIESNTGRLIGKMETEISKIKSTKTKFRVDDILFGKLRPKLNKVWYSNLEGICSTDIFVLRKKDAKLLPELYSWIFRDEDFVNEVLNGLQGAQLPRVGFEYLSKIKVPLPPPEVQEQVVAEIKMEQKAIDESKNLIGAMKKKIELKISEIWIE